jgi:hypothetical protein
MMKKVWPFAILILGLLVMSGSFVYYAGASIPYPDPTPELLAHQATEERKWGLLLALGLLVTVIGGSWLWRRLRVQRRASN